MRHLQWVPAQRSHDQRVYVLVLQIVHLQVFPAGFEAGALSKLQKRGRPWWEAFEKRGSRRDFAGYCGLDVPLVQATRPSDYQRPLHAVRRGRGTFAEGH